jgi:HSF-type DNA-binding
MHTVHNFSIAINMSQNNGCSNKMGVPPDKAELTNLPLKLHALLEEAERLGQTYIVSWENQGTAFKVHDKKRFVDEIMPKYFSTSNYQSFQRYAPKSAVLHSNICNNITQLWFSSIFR